MSFRIGIDIGGTFTDIALFDESMAKIYTLKVPTTSDFASGVQKSIEGITSDLSISPKDIRQFSHATTIVTNMIIRKEGARTALISTKGFEDILELGRMRRPDPYDLFYKVPSPLVERRLIFGLSERVDSKGRIVTALDAREIEVIAEKIKKENVVSVAVVFLFSFLNPSHEIAVKRILKEKLPDIEVSLSSEVIPEFREYERESTTVINAYTLPVVKAFLNGIEGRLRRMGMNTRVYIMNSSGGVVTLKTAKNKPVYLIESGPAAGVIVSAYIGRKITERNLVSFDMGGTTAKIGLVRDFEPEVTPDFEVGGVVHAGALVMGSGYPVKLPVIDLAEVGQGGGSIARIDEGGLLQVGPKSAEATPGPACYGRGGDEPTLTDAYVVMGIINPNNFLGGEMRLYPDLALKAIQKHISDKLRIDPITAAQGIVDVSNANMVRGLKVVTTKRGYDPRDFTLLAFGGGGPICCGDIAREVGIRKVIIPDRPGTLSAFGLLTTDMRYDYVNTYVGKVSDLNFSMINTSFQKLRKAAEKDLKEAGISSGRQRLIQSLDMRYVGQSYELEIPIAGGEIDDRKMSKIVKGFIRTHRRIYNHLLDEEVEIVNLRLKAIGILPKPRMKKFPIGDRREKGDVQCRRRVYVKQQRGFVDCSIYHSDQLMPGAVLIGPSVIEKHDSTVFIHPDFTAEVDVYRNIILKQKI